MAIEFKAAEPEQVEYKPIITVFGVGGAGGNAVNNMIEAGLEISKFVVANTDAQALTLSKCQNQIQLGILTTKGLGAGANPECGAEAAEESVDEIKKYLQGSHMVFITGGMGGGTGTGASPVIARIAKELGILTVGVVTRPFDFEGKRRKETAQKGLAQLQQYVDTMIVIPNQNLFRVTNDRTTFKEAFERADNVLKDGVQSVTDLITMPGLINLDFADIKAVMSKAEGKIAMMAMMGTGEASGEHRALTAAETAISNPLLDQSSMKGASGVLINITGGPDMTLYEVDEAANRIREEAGEDSDANIIVGSAFNPKLEGIIKVSVIATGIESGEKFNNEISGNQEKKNILSEEFLADKIEEEVPIFDHYNLEIEINNNEKINDHHDQELGSQNHEKFNIATEPVNMEIIESEPILNKKQSFLSKMWNSLKSHDQVPAINKAPVMSSNMTQIEKPLQGTLNSAESNVSEIPAFLRKK